MTPEEIKLRRLAAQHLLAPADPQRVVQDLCGLQTQFLSHALHGLSIRAGERNTAGLIKSWTNRGTMHLFSREDLPLFLHEGRDHFLRSVDTLDSDAYITAARKAYFADVILEAVARGVDRREELKQLCTRAGMGELESRSLFDPWGGLIRALCETGQLCHKVQEKKAYAICPPFEPMQEADARRELARRYFSHFGPATVKDAAYFFGTTQARVKTWLKELPVIHTEYHNRSYFYMGQAPAEDAIPGCLFLAGFDQLMLGYEKTESLFLAGTHMRGIFTRSGIVRPALLIDGTVAGWWNRKNRNLTVTLFEDPDTEKITLAAKALWPELQKITLINQQDTVTTISTGL